VIRESKDRNSEEIKSCSFLFGNQKSRFIMILALSFALPPPTKTDSKSADEITYFKNGVELSPSALRTWV